MSHPIEPLFLGIPGWTDDAMFECYETMVREASNGDIIVEVGTFMGRSLCFLCHTIRLSKKDIKVISVDLFPNKPVLTPDYEIYCDGPNGTLEIVRANVIQGGFQDMVKLIRGDSADAAQHFEDESLFAVYIDDDHSYDGVLSSVKAWLPKVRRGGILAGHDYEAPGLEGVKKAVDEVLGPVVQSGSTFTWRKP